MQEKNTERGEALEEEQRIDAFLLVLARFVLAVILLSLFELRDRQESLVQVYPSFLLPPQHPSNQRKAQKVKAPPKNKAPAKEEAHPEDKEDMKEVKDLEIKGIVKEAEEEK
ncbi:hypothetical protein BTUL_0029g00820 [Botrytis tulipae]|uniref:Uncharacterized protein n=1 Tax=Botrytis tulipae TaxID=87230 RepID=A0A4Z1EVC5_9HELO|nr:hypothetical protein BTUL_0029g00820 [Botrytis tulipae]